MGMYTEFHFNAKLTEDRNVIGVLKLMLGEDASLTIPSIPDHHFFSTDRWEYMLKYDSYYFDADTHSTMRWDEISHSYFLCIRCNLKNYGNEIEEFIDWITPYLNKQPGEFLGFYRYEETETPTLIWMKGSE